MTDLITMAGVEESISEAYQEAQRGNNERAKIRAELAQAQIGILLVEQISELAERMDELLEQLKQWDCDGQLAVSFREVKTVTPDQYRKKPRELGGKA